MNISLEEYDKLRNIEKKYYELLYSVSHKYMGESRHETALRYIQEKDNRICDPSGQKDSI